MKRQTEYFIIGIGIISILTAIYGGVRSGDFMDSISGLFIGLALIGTVLIERKNKGKTE